MKRLSIDLETYSPLDLRTTGIYPYVAHEAFEILLMAYAWEDEPVQFIDLAQGEVMPPELLAALQDPEVVKLAYNAPFEMACLSQYLGAPLAISQWCCTAVWARMVGLPGSLEGVSEALGLSQAEAKSGVGKSLIQIFCKPYKSRNGETRRILPQERPEQWEQFKAYCQQDVAAERAIRKRLEAFPIPTCEQKLWELDQRINQRGVAIDPVLVEQILTYDKSYRANLLHQARLLTGLSNPNSPKQLMGWLTNQGLQVTSLTAKDVEQLSQQATGKVAKVLAIRQALSKTSVKKYEAMTQSACGDQRIRGAFQFYGASRSGRWAGRLVQVHNLPTTTLKDLALARELARAGEFDTLTCLFGESAPILSQLVRTAFVPREGSRFIVCDYSAIEARVIAWLADEKWRLDVFEGEGKIYEASASQMFGVPVASIGKGSSLRQKGKIAELACGYGGGVKALEAMGGVEMGLSAAEMTKLIADWRRSNPCIVALWKKCERAAREALDTGWPVAVAKGVHMVDTGGVLWVQLPSGRALAYREPRLEGSTFTYKGIDGQTKKWTRLTTYGGKWVENIVQAIARDCLGVAMTRLEQAGYPITLHIHDEVVIECPIGTGSLAAVKQLMSLPIPWAPGLRLTAEGFETEFYCKD